MDGLPSFLLIDPEGRIIARARGGGEASAERLEWLIEDAMRAHTPSVRE